MVTSSLEPKTFLGHPYGLFALFGTEMWERLSYYGMRALLVLYLTNAVGLSRPDALGVYAVYTGLVYLTPLIGGRLADHYLGQRKAVFIGGILMALGQFALTQRASLYLGLGLLILGNGFFKPNISTMVGAQYPEGDKRRDGAYSIFYMGINLGALLAPWICGWLGEEVAWWAGFASAGVGMTLGILTFVFTQRLLQGAGMPPGRAAAPDSSLSARDWVEIVLGSALGFAAVSGALASWPALRPYWTPAGWPVPVLVLYKGAVLIALLGAFLYLTGSQQPKATAHEPLTAADWSRMLVILVIGLFSIVFWMGFEQSGGTLNLFAEEKTDRTALGFTVPTTWFQSVNPLFIVLLAPVFAEFWDYLARRRVPLPSIAKQGLGLVILGLAFGVMFLSDELERPTPAFRDQLEAAARFVAGTAAAVPLDRPASMGHPATVGPALEAAVAEFARTGEIPYKDLRDSARALATAGQADAARAVGAAYREATRSRVSLLWLIAVYLIFTVAELCLSPIGLSLVNRLAPARLASLMMASWFLCTAAANYLAGIMEELVKPYNLNLWAFLGVMAFVPGVLLLGLTPVLVKLSHGRV